MIVKNNKTGNKHDYVGGTTGNGKIRWPDGVCWDVEDCTFPWSAPKKVIVPKETTYVAAFLTFRCNLKCSYCINKAGVFERKRDEMTANDWIRGLNRLKIQRSQMLPITLCGGEPSVHSGFLDILKYIDFEKYIDILTNLQFNISEFMRRVEPARLNRDVPYASIRVSYHPGQHKLSEVIGKVKSMQEAHYSIGLYTVEHPDAPIDEIRKVCDKEWIDFRTKEFLGYHNGQLYGDYIFPEWLEEGTHDRSEYECKSTEILIGPEGNLYRCHAELYAGVNPIAHILDDDLEIVFRHRQCLFDKSCSNCDLKAGKNSRFQKKGYTAVDVRKIKP